VKRAIVDHLRDFVAMAMIVAIAVGVGGFILVQQGVRFPIIEEGPTRIWVEVENARGVTPGQGQTVRVAGMRVGDVGAVKLEDGKARVRMDLDPEHEKLVRRDATVLLRPRTGLKDMFLALDPGSRDRPAVKEGGVIDSANTLPDVNADEVLEALDADTRSYLGLLINGVGLGLKDRDQDLRQVFARLGPLHRDLRTLNTEVVKRKRNLARLINNYGSTVERLGEEDRDLTRLVLSADNVFDRLAQEDERISLAVSRLPSTLRQAESTLLTVAEFAETAGPAFRALRPAVREIDEANSELLPLAQTAEPVLREKVRPFVRRAQPYIRKLRPAARDLGTASPDLRKTFFQLNRLFNMGAYNPGGAEPLTGNQASDLARDEGLLFWLAWVSHNSNSLFSTGDAQGPFRRFVLLATCSTYEQMLLESGPTAPILEDLLGVKGVLSDTKVCPPS